MARAKQFPPSVDPGLPVEPAGRPGWTRTTFGDVLELVERPATLSPARHYQLVTVKRNREGVVPRETLRGAEVLTKTQFLVAADDFLMSKRQIIHGACGLVPAQLDGAIVSNEYAVLRPRPHLSLEYLRQLTHTAYFQRTCFHSSHGVDVEKMIFKIEKWFGYPLWLPPLEEQRRIAAVLSAIDASATAATDLVRAAVAFKQSLLHQEFQTAERVLLDDVNQSERPICYGILMPGQGHPSGVPVVKVKDIKAGEINMGGLLLTSPEVDYQYRRSRLRAGDVLLTIRGTTGRVAIVPPELNGANITQDTARISIEDPTLRDWIYYALQAPEVQQQIADNTRGQAVKGINIGDVRQLSIPMPKATQRSRIVAALATADRLIRTSTAEVAAMRNVKAAAAQELLAGPRRLDAPAPNR